MLKPYAGELLRVCLVVLGADNEENGLVCLRIAFDLHKAFRPGLAEQVAPFLDFVRKVGPLTLADTHTASSSCHWPPAKVHGSTCGSRAKADALPSTCTEPSPQGWPTLQVLHSRAGSHIR